MAESRTVIYVAATPAAAETGASALADAADELAVDPVTTPAGVRDADADCVVFAETPTTSEGASVLDVIAAADGTPLVLFTESSFDPAMARSTDGIAGYVRRDAPDAVAHLVDEIAWHASDGAAAGDATAPESADRHRRAAETLARDYSRLTRELKRESTDTERLAATVDRLDTAAAHLAVDRGRARTERERIEAAFGAFPAPACAFAVDPATPTVTAITDAFRDRFGLDPDEAVGRSVADVFGAAGIALDDVQLADALVPQRADAARRAGEPAIEDAEPLPAPGAEFAGAETTAVGAVGTDATGADRGTTFDGRVDAGDGTRDLAVTVVPPAGPTAGTDGGIGLLVCRDVTDRLRAERELAARSRRLEAIGDVLDAELREPLNVARGYLEVAAETGDPEHVAEVESAHDALRAATDHLARLVGRDAVVVERDAIELRELARRAWVAVDTGDARLELGPNGRFRGDPGQLRDVFEHLLAVATGDDGGDTTTEEAAADGDSESAAPIVSVGATDDGFYIAGSAVTDEADPFAGRTATADGTGLRLGRVESVADAHGWRVGVAESEDGTAFAFRGVEMADVE